MSDERFDDEERLARTLGPAFEPMAPPPAFEEELLARLEDRLAERRPPTEAGLDREPVELVEWEQPQPERPQPSARRRLLVAAAAAVALLVGGVIWAAQTADEGEDIAADATAVRDAIAAIDVACAATLPGLDPTALSFELVFGDYSAEERAVEQLRTLVDGIQPAIEEARRDRLLADITTPWDDVATELQDIERLLDAGDAAFVGARVLRTVEDVQQILRQLETQGAAACTWQ